MSKSTTKFAHTVFKYNMKPDLLEQKSNEFLNCVGLEVQEGKVLRYMRLDMILEDWSGLVGW